MRESLRFTFRPDEFGAYASWNEDDCDNYSRLMAGKGAVAASRGLSRCSSRSLRNALALLDRALVDQFGGGEDRKQSDHL
jgi:hypothetical protein